MSKGKKSHRGVTQTSQRKAASKSIEPLRPDSGNIEKPGRSTLVSNDLNAPVGPHIPRLGHEQVADRANAIWVQRGCPQDQDEANWHEAEAQLRAEL
jgi:hypothetical protein